MNNVFAPRIHKSNAQNCVHEAATMLTYYRECLVALAAMTPATIEDAIEARNKVDEAIDGMRDEWRKEWMAQYIVDYPKDCKDELVESDRGAA